jgi:pimeloyl-ACP methyl ester carboxylesterase
VVIYAPGFNNPAWDNADLCEYLASYGYCVIASGSFGPNKAPMSLDVEGLNAQANDISLLVSYAATLPNAQASSVAVVGYSWGGLANVFAAARDRRIGALVALDGSLRFSPGLIKRVSDVDPSQMDIPLLSIAQALRTPEEQDEYFARYPDHAGPSVLNAWNRGDLIAVNFLSLSHMEYSSMHQRNERAWETLLGPPHQKKADYSRADGIEGYAWLARYVRAFLDAYLKHEKAPKQFLKNTGPANGAPLHFLTSTFRPASSQDTPGE